MRVNIRILLMVLAVAWVHAEAQTLLREQNHVTCTLMGDAQGSPEKAMVTRTFYDGIGRVRQNIAIGQGGNGCDIVSRNTYDGFGCVDRKWLAVPTPSQSGAYIHESVLQNAYNSFYGDDEVHYTQLGYNDYGTLELNFEQGPGLGWRGHPTRYNIRTCDTTGIYSCRVIMAEPNGEVVMKSMYPIGALQVNETKDADGRRIITFTNRNGRTVLQRIVSADERHNADTRWVYDSRGDLICTISPQGMAELEGVSGIVPSDVLAKFANCYRYDLWHRVVERSIAGCEKVEYVYNKMGQPILSRDGEQRKNGTWRAVKYDGKHRPILEGILQSTLSREALQMQFGDMLFTEYFTGNQNNIEWELLYSNTLVGGFTPYRAWYYDDYAFCDNTHIPAQSGYEIGDGTSAIGRCTGTAEIVDGTVWLTATHYDYHGLTKSQCMVDIFGQQGRVADYYRHDFRGNVVAHLQVVDELKEKRVTETHRAEWRYTLDHADRVSHTALSVDGGTFTPIQTTEFDGLGRVKKLAIGLAAVHYGYNVRSNITGINSDVFSQTLYYGSNPEVTDYATYTGQVVASTTQYPTAQDKAHSTYYRYNWLGHLSSAQAYSLRQSETFETDLNANVIGLKREYKGETIQDASLNMNGNQAAVVYDMSLPYYQGEVPQFQMGIYNRHYDADGRLISDDTRNIAFITYYPFQNLPKLVRFADGSSVVNSYSPSGTLIQRDFITRYVKTVTRVDRRTGDTTVVERATSLTERRLYRGAFERQGSKWILHTGVGHYDLTEGKHYYYIKDNLGSTVAVVDQSGVAHQLTAYYPSGVPYDLTAAEARATDQLHIGNRWIAHEGMNTYDNTARMHYPVLPSFDTPDPLAEQYPHLSPYAHCAANPLMYVDPDGRASFWSKGKVIGNDGIEDNRILVLRTDDKDLSKKEIKETKKFIEANSGNSEAFANNEIAYSNSIEIEPSAKNRQAMVTEVNRDNGRGGTIDSNNREYGGTIQNGEVVVAEPGPVSIPEDGNNAYIDLPSGFSSFHSHPSGSIPQFKDPNTFGCETKTPQFEQEPSGTDISVAGTNTHYLFARGNGNVYIYTSKGVQAIMSMKYFVTPKTK